MAPREVMHIDSQGKFGSILTYVHNKLIIFTIYIDRSHMQVSSGIAVGAPLLIVKENDSVTNAPNNSEMVTRPGTAKRV